MLIKCWSVCLFSLKWAVAQSCGSWRIGVCSFRYKVSTVIQDYSYVSNGDIRSVLVSARIQSDWLLCSAYREPHQFTKSYHNNLLEPDKIKLHHFSPVLLLTCGWESKPHENMRLETICFNGSRSQFISCVLKPWCQYHIHF